MKALITVGFLICQILCFCQKSNCNSVNVPAEKCTFDTIRISQDTIFLLKQNDECAIDFFSLKDGIYSVYHPEGEKIANSFSIKNRHLNGEFLEYQKNGYLIVISYFLDGVSDGHYLQQNNQGQIIRIGRNIQGVFIGATFEYWNNGKIAISDLKTETSRWREHRTYWDENGKPIEYDKFKLLWECP